MDHGRELFPVALDFRSQHLSVHFSGNVRRYCLGGINQNTRIFRLRESEAVDNAIVRRGHLYPHSIPVKGGGIQIRKRHIVRMFRGVGSGSCGNLSCLRLDEEMSV